MVLQGVRSVLAVPLGVSEKVFGIIYADSPIAEGRFTEDHLKYDDACFRRGDSR